MRIHLKPHPRYPYSNLWVEVASPVISKATFRVPKQMKLEKRVKDTLFLLMYILSTQCRKAQRLQQFSNYAGITRRWLHPAAFCLLSFGKADNGKTSIQPGTCTAVRKGVHFPD